MKQVLHGLTKKISAQIIRRTVEDHEVVETLVATKVITGLLLPLKARAISCKPEGERSWIWKELTTAERLELGWTFVDAGDQKRYRVMSVMDYSIAGFYVYELAQRGQGAAS